MFGTEPGLSYASKQHHLINKFESYLVQREYFRWKITFSLCILKIHSCWTVWKSLH